MGESNYLTPVLWGAGIGFATGFFAPIGFSVMFQKTIDEESDPKVEINGEILVSGFVCAIIGAGIGYVVGLLIAEDDLPIKFNSDRSVLRLKDYAMYNFRNLKMIEDDYHEIK
jgi:formate hydrogenlyase subunit 3/multisubunit Na+/H+ antiporter MnhD subunit